MVKHLKNCRIVNLDSSKEGFWSTECNAKNLSSLKSIVSEKIKEHWQKLSILHKLSFLTVYLDFFRNCTLQRAEVFCVAFSAPKPFFWAIKMNNPTNFQIFHYRGGPWWFMTSNKLTTPQKMAVNQKQNYFCAQNYKWIKNPDSTA